MLAGGNVARANKSEGLRGRRGLGSLARPFVLLSGTSRGVGLCANHQAKSEARDGSHARNLPDFPVLPD
jgi:hypothetical protein